MLQVNNVSVVSLNATNIFWKAFELHHIAVTWGPDGCSLYIDNKLIGTKSYTGCIGIENSFKIVSQDKAIIDEFKIWKGQKTSFPTHIPHILLKKTCDKKYASPGGTVTYTITYTNTGFATATDVNIIEVLPEHCVLIGSRD
ncbi:MAG: hypothetical protein QME07_05810 [bacterium]|nr:hypothetical protein [bacterium]